MHVMRFEVGQILSFTRAFTQEDFDSFAALTGDNNPIHVDLDFSAQTKFGRTVAHGMLLYGTICGLLSKHFPGATQLEQDLMFPAPTFAGEAMTISVEIIEITPNRRARLRTTISNRQGELTCEGETVLRWEVTVSE